MYELMIDAEDFEGESRYTKYSFFNVCEIMVSYILYITGYFGIARDDMGPQYGYKFSIKDRDFDADYTINCAIKNKRALWYLSEIICHMLEKTILFSEINRDEN